MMHLGARICHAVMTLLIGSFSNKISLEYNIFILGSILFLAIDFILFRLIHVFEDLVKFRYQKKFVVLK